MYETSCQSRFDARYWMLGAGALGQPRGMEWRGGRTEFRMVGHMYTHGCFKLMYGRSHHIIVK